jgi:large subunit ribosomal protein L1
MAKAGKKYLNALKLVDRRKRYSIDEAIELVKQTAYTKFDGNVLLSIRLGVDPKKSDQMVRGAVVLPHGIGKERKVLVFAKGEKETEARNAGADYVGGEDLIKKIQEGWMDFDTAIATPDMMPAVGKIGKILGPHGLMPNPKTGTVTFDVAKAVKEAKAGKVEFKTDKGGNVHMVVGKVSFDKDALKENIKSAIDTLIKLKPPSSKGSYLKSVTISATMGPGIKCDISQIYNWIRGKQV